MKDLKQEIQSLASDVHPYVVEMRRHLHAHPELSFREYETAAFIKSKLDEGFEGSVQDIADTGLLAVIEGQDPGSRVMALRADTDALPILEENELEYKSRNDGVMHACGHDVHTSSLLGTALILSKMKDRFRGTVKLLFQPAEERFPGGARKMIEEGALENPVPAGIFGQHVYPDLEVGKIGFHSGKYMASCDELYLEVHGQGGHAASPHRLIDPILIASHLVIAAQQLVSRHANPMLPTVVSFGRLDSPGGSTNVIPDKVTIEGTLRTMNETWRSEVKGRLEQLFKGLAASMGGRCEVEIREGYPYLVNDVPLTERARTHAMEYMGEENVVEVPMRMGAEDFSYYSQRVPACFYRLGTANASKGITSGLHTSTFNIDEEALRISTGLMSWLAVRELQS